MSVIFILLGTGKGHPADLRGPTSRRPPAGCRGTSPAYFVRIRQAVCFCDFRVLISIAVKILSDFREIIPRPHLVELLPGTHFYIVLEVR